MRKRKGHLLWVLAVNIALSSPVAATTIGAAPTGPVTSGTGAGGYLREWVALEERGDLLIGFPRAGPVRVLALHAPTHSGTSLILRWNERDDGKTSLFLAAPEKLSAVTRRVTLYLDASSPPPFLYDLTGETWAAREPYLLEVAMPFGDDPARDVVAIVAAGLGPYWLVHGSSKPISKASARLIPSVNPLVEGSLTRAIANWIWPLAMIAIAWSVARLCHNRQSHH